MERLRQLAGPRKPRGERPWVFSCLLLLAGCATPGGPSLHEVKKFVGIEPTPAEPATQVVCFWQRELKQLPDPTRDGQLAPGLAGQLFLLDGKSQPSPVAGDVTVAVHDATPRPAGQPAQTPEVWHFTKETVERMAAADERFGRSHVLFLPWPPAWRDVQAVKILTRYDPTGGTTLHAGEVKMTLDLGGATPGGGWAPASLVVPAGAQVLEQAGR